MTQTSLSWLAIALALGGYARGADIGPKPKPNILHIHADDHRPGGGAEHYPPPIAENTSNRSPPSSDCSSLATRWLTKRLRACSRGTPN